MSVRAAPPPFGALGSGETECSVCYDDFADPFPLPDDSSRAPDWLFACERHATCIACDNDMQARSIAHGMRASLPALPYLPSRPHTLDDVVHDRAH